MVIIIEGTFENYKEYNRNKR